MQQKKVYKLELSLRVRAVDERGASWNGENLEISDTVDLGAAGFMEIAGILGRFHELAGTITAERNSDQLV